METESSRLPNLPPAGASRRYLSLLVGSLSLITLACVTLLLPVPYVVLSPSPAFNTLGEFAGKPMITFPKDVKTYPATGAIDFTTVAVTRPEARVTLVDAIAAYFEPGREVVRRRAIYPEGESAETSEKVTRLLFTSAQYSARVAAVRAAGYKVPIVPVVREVTKGYPAEGQLKRGDVLVRIDGKTMRSSLDAFTAIAMKKPGDRIAVTYKRGAALHTVKLKAAANPEDRKRARIGITMATPKLPFKVDFHTGSKIGGSSAGAMFALGIYDRLTPGSLTGGAHVAGTGTIELDGSIGPIGGVRQKAVGAARNGATIFLVPARNCADAALDVDRQGRLHGMRLVRIDTLDSAIRSLHALAKDPKANVPQCESPH
ncbi:MAG TPA: PDZ domain-containing protein [Aeromicrobium sp.]|nr:PDZ domain-containing protein [Aeromicrobium sp.]